MNKFALVIKAACTSQQPITIKTTIKASNIVHHHPSVHTTNAGCAVLCASICTGSAPNRGPAQPSPDHKHRQLVTFTVALLHTNVNDTAMLDTLQKCDMCTIVRCSLEVCLQYGVHLVTQTFQVSQHQHVCLALTGLQGGRGG